MGITRVTTWENISRTTISTRPLNLLSAIRVLPEFLDIVSALCIQGSVHEFAEGYMNLEFKAPSYQTDGWPANSWSTKEIRIKLVFRFLCLRHRLVFTCKRVHECLHA